MGDLAVEPDANEITAALDLLKDLPHEGAIVTGDAIFAQRALSRHIREAGGHYLFTVKSNQPTLRRDIETAFGGAFPPRASRRRTCVKHRRSKRVRENRNAAIQAVTKTVL